jgi:hypothetical protein
LDVPIISKRLPDLHDGVIERGIRHILARPQMLEQFLLEDHPVVMVQEVGEHLKHLGPQLNHRPGLAQLIA